MGAPVKATKGTSTLATVTASLGSASTVGNLLVLRVAADDYAASPPSGWNQSTGMKQETYHGGYFWWKISAGETSVNYTIGSATNSAWTLEEYTGPFDASPYDISNGTLAVSSASSAATPSVTPSAGDRLGLATWGSSNSSGDMSADLTGITNSFTLSQSSGPVSATGTRDNISGAYIDITANGSTAYSTTASFPFTKQSHSAMLIFFKKAAGGAGAGSASGNSTVTAVGKSEAKSVGVVSGTGTAVATGKSAAKSDGVASGVGTAVAGGKSTAKSIGATTGSAAVAAGGASIAKASGSAVGTSVVTGTAASAGHAYWRALLVHRDTFCTANEMEMSTTIGGADIATLPNLIYSSQYNGTTFAAANVVDNNTGTSWFSTNGVIGGQSYIGQNFGTSTDVQEIRLYVTDGTSYPSTVLIQYSDDGSSWVTTDSYSFDSSMLNQWNSFPVAMSYGGSSGAAAGSSVVVATGKSVAESVGAAAGSSTVVASGVANFKSSGSASGSSVIAATGKSEAKSVGSAVGTSTVVATGNEIRKVSGSAAGISTAAAEGAALAQSTGSAAGTSTAQAGSLPAGGATGTAEGNSIVEAAGKSLAEASGEAAGTSSVSAEIIDIGWKPEPPVANPWNPVDNDDSNWTPIELGSQEWQRVA